MAHIHTNPGEHDPTSSAMIIRFDRQEPQLLLHLHKKLGKWMQPGGHVELHENPWQAVLHEIEEETGYEPNQLHLLQPKQRMTSLSGAVLHPVPVCENTHDFDGGRHKHTDRAYAFAADSEPRNMPGKDESSSLRWVTLEGLQAIPKSEIIENVREIGVYVLRVCAVEWERVPLDVYPRA